jgi:hypothetical protein
MQKAWKRNNMTISTQTTKKKFTFKSEHKTFNSQTKSMAPFVKKDRTMYGWPITARDILILGTTTYEPGQLQKLSLEPVVLAIDSHVGRNYWSGNKMVNTIKEHLEDKSGWVYMVFHKSSGKRIVHGFLLTDNRGYLIDKWILGPTRKSYSVIYESLRHLSNADDVEVEHVDSRIQQVEYTILDTYKIRIPGTDIEQEIVERRLIELEGPAQEKVGRHYTTWDIYPEQKFLNATKLMSSRKVSQILAEQFKTALTKALQNIVDQRDLFPLAWPSMGKGIVSPYSEEGDN